MCTWQTQKFPTKCTKELWVEEAEWFEALLHFEKFQTLGWKLTRQLLHDFVENVLCVFFFVCMCADNTLIIITIIIIIATIWQQIPAKKKSGLRFLCQDSILKKVLNVWVQIPLTTVKVSFSLICALLGSLVDSSNVFNYCLCSLDTTDRWVTLISSRDRIFSPERTTIQQGDGVFVHILAAFATLMYLHALDVSVNTFRLMWFLVLVKKRRQKQIHVKENVMLSFNEQMVKPYSCLHRQTTF